uniref:Zinc finger, CCHC-type, retrotransposon Gag domain protein n=1 Tax=Tanacetum cinerariifolium TaxID=118510 RepID=A0A6L2NVT4_TANCI|nr:zinc finger, CCHC-type, retrotransposon Gag domain protein [Tanacetum cinerariifolium]
MVPGGGGKRQEKQVLASAGKKGYSAKCTVTLKGTTGIAIRFRATGGRLEEIRLFSSVRVRSLIGSLVRQVLVFQATDWRDLALIKGGDEIMCYQRDVTIMVSEPGFETVGSKVLTSEDWMVNTRTDVDLSAAIQNALQTLLPQIRAEIREEFHTSSRPSDAGGNPPPVTIHTWLERFNKQKPNSFEKETAPMDTENWISHMEKIFNVMGCEDAFKTRLAVYKFEGNALAWWKAYKEAKGGDAWLVTVTWADFKKLFFLQFFPRAEQERLKKEYHFIRQTSTETSTEFMQRFLRLAGFLGAAAGTEEEQAKNFQWGIRRSTLNHLMCMSYTDVAHVSNAARNYEILHERDNDDSERPDKR